MNLRRIANIIVPLAMIPASLAGAEPLRIGHGTFSVVGLSANYAVVSIDTLVSDMQTKTPMGYVCKIRPLSQSSFFFDRGTAIGYLGDREVYNVRDLASSLYVQMGRPKNFSALAEAWGAQMIGIFNQRPQEFAKFAAKPNGTVVEGIFVGLGDGGDISFDGVVVRYNPNGLPYFNLFRLPLGYVDMDFGPTYFSGDVRVMKVMAEFVPGEPRTERAKKAISALGKLPPEPDGIAMKYETYVKAVRDWSGDQGIGGDIATIILERGQKWRWFHKADVCPDNT